MARAFACRRGKLLSVKREARMPTATAQSDIAPKVSLKQIINNYVEACFVRRKRTKAVLANAAIEAVLSRTRSENADRDCPKRYCAESKFETNNK